MLRDLELDHEPIAILYDADESVLVDLIFPLDQFPTATMERLGRNFIMFLTTLLRTPEQRVNDILLLK